MIQKSEKTHESSITYLSVLSLGEAENYILTMCMGGTLNLWSNTGSQYEVIGELLFGKNLQEAFQLTALGKEHLLMTVGGYDSKIHCYTCRRPSTLKEKVQPSKYFTYKFSLTGHQNSLKDFSFTAPKIKLPNEVQYLASCS